MMKVETAINVMLGIVGAVIVFHLSIVLKIIPYDIAWGGRLKNDPEMYVFESISIIVNLFLGLIIMMKGNYITPLIPIKVVNGVLWVFLVLFILNTFANLFSVTDFEKLLTILTFISAILIWFILRGKEATT